MSKTEKNDKETGQKLPVRGLAIWLLLLALFLATFQMLSQQKEGHNEISWNPDFVTMVKEGRIRSCEIVMEAGGGNQYIRGEMIDAADKLTKFKVHMVITEYVQRWLDENGVTYRYKAGNPLLWTLVQGVLPFLLVLGLLYFLFVRQMRMAGKGAMSFGKSRAKLLNRDNNKMTFSDVAGVEEAKEEVQEIVDFLKDPKRFQKLGGRIPKGVLLVGPPGTGKTLLARAIAGEAAVPFFNISGSDFVEMFVGVGASRVRDMFEQGRKSAPCLIFIDEIDAVGRSRFSGIGGGHDEREQTLNALLVEMDGFDAQEGVIIIAATNRPDVLDQALLRPGRFDRQIMVELPTLDGREAILRIHTRKIRLGEHVELNRIARGTPGFSGADLANLVNEAALLAARRGADAVEIDDLEEARDKVKWGRERRSRMLDEKEKELTAYHEAGHALVLALLDNTEPLHKVTIIPRGASLGATMQLPEKDRFTESQSKLISMLKGIMGGRAAEEIVFGDITTGASNDLKQATNIAKMMVCEWGMSPKVGPQFFGEGEEVMWLSKQVSRSQNQSDETAQLIDSEIGRLLNESHEAALTLIRDNRDKLNLIAELLLDQETLDGSEVDEIVKHGRVLSEAERAEEADTGELEDPEPVEAALPESYDEEAGEEPPSTFPGSSQADAPA